MLDYILYERIPGGQVKNLAGSSDHAGEYSELLGVIGDHKGIFEVKAKGNKPAIGSHLLLPIKGSKQMCLRLPVQKVEPLITPLGGWSATCDGPEYREFLIKTMEINCDQCGTDYKLEFVAFSGDDNADALAAMSKQGWSATIEKQICPKCV